MSSQRRRDLHPRRRRIARVRLPWADQPGQRRGVHAHDRPHATREPIENPPWLMVTPVHEHAVAGLPRVTRQGFPAIRSGHVHG
ncbi:hypothetical protein, partial [uncultured Thiocystis sp.]|uniref:hypothetical protein n=1 Tax=uncultured Thiocystis sp. TaxID=1202134 RepID=UPI0025F879CC